MLLPLATALLVAAAPAAGPAAARPRPKKGARPPIAGLQPAPGGALAPRPVGVRPLDAVGTVRNVVRQRAFLDAGSRDGLAAGQVLQLLRKGAPAGSCTVEEAAERSAVCAGPDVRPGDTFAASPRAAGSLPAQLPARPSAEEQARRLAAVQATGFALVEDKAKAAGAAAVERTRRLEVGLGLAGWFAVEAPTLAHGMVHAAARDAPAFAGARLNLDLSAASRTQPDEERYQPGRRGTVWLREASLSWAERDRRWMLAAGRVLPWRVPGGPTFDGAQVGYRIRSGEVGLFGGAVPDPLTTAPGLDRATAGGYGAWEAVAGRNVFRGEARLAWLKLPDARSRIEGEATAQAWLARQVDVSAQARLGFGDYAAPGKLDAARLDLAWAQPGRFSLAGGFRYDESLVPDQAAPALGPGRTRHAWASAGWDGLRWLQLRLVGGLARDVASGLRRSWVGPEAAAPRLLGRWGGLAAGYAEELGDLSGRSAWLQGDLAPWAATRLLARLSWMMDARPSPLQAAQNVGLTLSSVSDLAGWLRLRLSASSHLGVALSEEGGADWAAGAFAALEARY